MVFSTCCLSIAQKPARCEKVGPYLFKISYFIIKPSGPGGLKEMGPKNVHMQYGVCPNKLQGDDQKVRQNQQNLRHLQTVISQVRNKLLTNFQRLESTTIHGHMVCVQKSDMGMTKNRRKSAKIRSYFKTAIPQARNKLSTFKG